MNSTFPLENFIGYIFLDAVGNELRPRIDHDLKFRSESDPTVVIPESRFPVGLLYWEPERQGYKVSTVMPAKNGDTK